MSPPLELSAMVSPGRHARRSKTLFVTRRAAAVGVNWCEMELQGGRSDPA